MQSFRTELENPIVEKDIIELEKKINSYRKGDLSEEKFRSLRLARGIYGQRQQGVQMIRIKLPFGRVSPKQLLRLADISDEYSTGNLHLTTRQDIQIHYVSLEKTPELWAKLEEDDITIREACGNTVRNVTASATAGIDPNEPFDVSPYAETTFQYFLRKPFGQELGRKFKIAFSATDEDSAFTYIHDLGFIPKTSIVNGEIKRGFKVLVGGGLGAQPFLAETAFEFLAEDRIIPFTEALIRVFDRYGERNSRHKARLKYLLNKIGLPELLRLAEEEHKALSHSSLPVKTGVEFAKPKKGNPIYTTFKISDSPFYQAWIKTNVFEQKQQTYYGVYIRVPLGNIRSETIRLLAEIVGKYAADDLRLTINQGFLLRYVQKQALPTLYRELDKIGLALPGFDSTADITACPGTDTCNLGISSSTGIAVELERVILDEFPDLIYNHNIKIKISGCMNSCSQHGLAQIGFHGSSSKVGEHVVPALQLLLGGGTLGNGAGRIGHKIIKIPSKRGPAALRLLLNDFNLHATENEYFNSFYDRKGKDYFYQLLKGLADTSTLSVNDFMDWGQENKFKTEIGIGECAGVMIDLVSTLLFEADEKQSYAKEALDGTAFPDAIYYAYSAFVHAAKALLLGEQVQCNTQSGILTDFDKHFVENGVFDFPLTFKAQVMQINQEHAGQLFAAKYVNELNCFLKEVKRFRTTGIKKRTNETLKK
jgi:sulfite reductase (ferredoxin)